MNLMGYKYVVVRENIPLVVICAVAFAVLGLWFGALAAFAFGLLSIILSIIALCKGQLDLGVGAIIISVIAILLHI